MQVYSFNCDRQRDSGCRGTLVDAVYHFSQKARAGDCISAFLPLPLRNCPFYLFGLNADDVQHDYGEDGHTDWVVACFGMDNRFHQFLSPQEFYSRNAMNFQEAVNNTLNRIGDASSIDTLMIETGITLWQGWMPQIPYKSFNDLYESVLCHPSDYDTYVRLRLRWRRQRGLLQRDCRTYGTQPDRDMVRGNLVLV